MRFPSHAGGRLGIDAVMYSWVTIRGSTDFLDAIALDQNAAAFDISIRVEMECVPARKHLIGASDVQNLFIQR